jgi:hypothetical protein
VSIVKERLKLLRKLGRGIAETLSRNETRERIPARYISGDREIPSALEFRIVSF